MAVLLGIVGVVLGLAAIYGALYGMSLTLWAVGIGISLVVIGVVGLAHEDDRWKTKP